MWNGRLDDIVARREALRYIDPYIYVRIRQSQADHDHTRVEHASNAYSQPCLHDNAMATGSNLKRRPKESARAYGAWGVAAVVKQVMAYSQR